MVKKRGGTSAGAQNQDGQFEPEGGPAENRVKYPAGAGAVADYLAGRLTYLSHGLVPQLAEVQAGVLPTGRLRVWLRESGRTGSVFRDPLDRPLGAGEWERIRAGLEEDDARQPQSGEKPSPALVPTVPADVKDSRVVVVRRSEENPSPVVSQPIEPDMIELPGGSFRMGCVSGKGCQDDEKPVHEVEIRPFAIGRYEVTFEEYDRYAEVTGRKRPDDEGWGRGRRPVINVSWDDATAYAQWLSERTGRRYRLPSESEWEYAARAGTETEYWWGDGLGKNRANCARCGSEWDNKQTAPVGSFEPNPWDLYDTAGNVWEWARDCWHPSYHGAPVDGSSWESGDCTGRVVRGGSWDIGSVYVRSATRDRFRPDIASSGLGFRLARPPAHFAGAAVSKEPAGVRAGVHGAVSSAPRDRGRRRDLEGPLRPGAGRMVRTSRACLILGALVFTGGAVAEKTVESSVEAAATAAPAERPCVSRPGEGPEMVLIEAGRFMMGSPEDEEDRSADEGTAHGVAVIRPFALGRCEVTVGEFRLFVAETGWVTDSDRGGGCYAQKDDGANWERRKDRGWRNPGFAQGDDHPVVCVSWNDTRAYTAWISRRTGMKYRLPTEAEWEYAARAGSGSARFWGDAPEQACRYANVADRTAQERFPDWIVHDCDDGDLFTAAVGGYRSSGFGLYDILGNVWEWTQDCRQPNYQGAPVDGSSWESGDCAERVVRGGSWNGRPEDVRSANRFWDQPDVAFYTLGFRLARTI